MPKKGILSIGSFLVVLRENRMRFQDGEIDEILITCVEMRDRLSSYLACFLPPK